MAYQPPAGNAANFTLEGDCGRLYLGAGHDFVLRLATGTPYAAPPAQALTFAFHRSPVVPGDGADFMVLATPASIGAAQGSVLLLGQATGVFVVPQVQGLATARIRLAGSALGVSSAPLRTGSAGGRIVLVPTATGTVRSPIRVAFAHGAIRLAATAAGTVVQDSRLATGHARIRLAAAGSGSFSTAPIRSGTGAAAVVLGAGAVATFHRPADLPPRRARLGWGRSKPARQSRRFAVPKCLPMAGVADGYWDAAASVSAPVELSTIPAVALDRGAALEWQLSRAVEADRSSRWSISVPGDSALRLVSPDYGHAGVHRSAGVWPDAVPRDAARLVPWPYKIVLRRPEPWIRHPGNAVDFAVAGGGVDFFLICQAPGQRSGALLISIDGAPYLAPVTNYPDRTYVIPSGRAADIQLNRRYLPVLDAFGRPRMISPALNSGQVAPWGIPHRADADHVLPWSAYSRQSNTDWGVPSEPPDRDDDDPSTIVIPVRRVYMTVNQQTLVIAATGEPVEARSMRIGIDVDSWVWSFSAAVDARALGALIAPAGSVTEVIATINGNAFRFGVEQIARSRRFGSGSLEISGRGRAAWFGEPFASEAVRMNAEAMTAQQLFASALAENGVSIGWDIDWQITDWLVPAGAWSHSGTPIAACLSIAAAGGAYVQAAPNTQVLAVLPRYPLAPWEWSGVTPDYDVPEAVATVESLGWVDRPQYNAVYVSGSNAGGVLGHVIRAGSAGDRVAPMVTEPLCTHADAARQRGLAVLGDTGRKIRLELTMPVLDGVGIIPPGKFFRYPVNGSSMVGLTRAVAVDATFPKVRQTISVEFHEL